MPMIQVELSGGASSVDCLVVGAGPGLVLVHGTGADALGTWGALIDSLSRRFTVVAPTLSGSGATTDAGGPLSIDDLVAQVVAAADAARLDSYHLAGHSLGAVVAAATAARERGRVRSLFLHAGWAATDPWQAFQFETWQRLLRVDKSLLSRVLQLTAMGPGSLSARSAADFDVAVAGFDGLFDASGMARQCALNARVDITADLERISAPTLVVAGSHDLIVPRHHQRQLAQAIPSAAYLELAGGHALPFEEPALFRETLENFLDDVSAPVGSR
ncbi:alpha/beta fold hydrolase [Streptomyces sp. NPDC059900]|uniref:alpha/beta fold hydrolase n=1 Tax=Streptomyces sp. NPDC059900 TaxID=3155816 RepID=UPI0034227C94